MGKPKIDPATSRPRSHGLVAESDVKSRRLIVIAWMFVVIVSFLLAFTYYSIGLLSAGRAFVGGEGLWSKAQKDMTYALARYARSHDTIYFQSYRDALAVSLGDRQARLELEKPDPDLHIARAGLIQGRNHPDDIDGMIRLFRQLRNIAEIDKAITLWSQADGEIDQLTAVAGRIEADIHGGTMDQISTQRYLEQIYQINQLLVPIEDEFSYTLGVATRKMQSILMFVLFAVVSVLLAGAFLFSRRLVRQSERIETALRKGEYQFRMLLQFSPMPIVIVRLSNERILYANDHAMTLFKVLPDSLERLRSRSFFAHQRDRIHMHTSLRVEGRLREREVLLQNASGEKFWVLLSAQYIAFNDQDCLLTVLTDINERKSFQQELQRRAFHDELTGLPNRAMFMNTVRGLLARAEATESIFAILFIDLDHFKNVNDRFGHAIGDRLLQQFALRLGDSVRQIDVVARLGGDEFVVLIEECPDIESIEHTAQKILKAIATTYVLESHSIDMTNSIGISCYPQHGTDVSSLLRNADIAMYRAKQRGRNNVQFYEKVN